MAAEFTQTAGLDDFDHLVIEPSRTQPVLVDFWADWCPPCIAIAPHLSKVIADLNGAVHLVKVEVDEGENMKLAGHYKLRGFPTVMLFHQGEEQARFAGSRPSRWILQWLEEHLEEVISS